MADVKIGQPDPAPAKFITQSYSGPLEPFFDAGAEVVDIDVPYTLAADTDLPVLSVVKYTRATGAIVLAQVAAGVSDATHILAQPLKGLNASTGRVALHTSGHWNSRALNFHATFNTDALKEAAFVTTNNNIRVSTPKFSNDAIDIPN
jgi:hypothetical protein